MLRITSFCLLIALEFVTSAPPPSQCTRRRPLGLEFGLLSDSLECCVIPMIFKEKDFDECGIDKDLQLSPNCSENTCLFKKNNLIKNDTKIDTQGMIAHLDRFAEVNSDFKEAIEISKVKCLNKDILKQPQICEAIEVHFCVFLQNLIECPEWRESGKCNEVKKYIEECESYFY